MKENHVNLIHYKCIIRNELIESRSKNIVRVSIFRNLLKRSISWIPLEIKQKKLNQGKSAFVTTTAPRTINYSLVTPVDCPSEPHYNETSRIRRKTKYLVDAILFNDLGSHVVYVNRRHVVCVYVYIYIYIYIYIYMLMFTLSSAQTHSHTKTGKINALGRVIEEWLIAESFLMWMISSLKSTVSQLDEIAVRRRTASAHKKKSPLFCNYDVPAILFLVTVVCNQTAVVYCQGNSLKPETKWTIRY